MRRLTPLGNVLLVAGVVLFFAWLLLFLTTGCANKRHSAVVADTAISGSLFALQDTEAQLFSAGAITPEQHRAFNKALLPALKAGQSLTTTLQAWHPGEQPPIELATITRAVQQATDAVILVLPAAQKDKLLPLVLAIQQSVLNVLLLAAGGGQ